MYKIQGSIERVLSPPKTCNNDQRHKPNSVFEAVNAEKVLWRLIASKGIGHTDVLIFFRKARSSYEKSILDDHELAELQNIEYSLWKLHYKHIDQYRKRIRESSSGEEDFNFVLLDKFTSFLSEAMEFYQGLITKIRSIYGITEELIFLNECDFPTTVDCSKVQRCKFSCHRYLVCIGDLARYKELYGNTDSHSRNWSVAATHYLKASQCCPDSGNPHNQLAVLATYVDDEFLALYHCIRSLAVHEPFPDAWDNLILHFEKNKLSHLHLISDEATFNFDKPHERITRTVVLCGQSSLWSLIIRMLSFFYLTPSSATSLDFPCILNSTIQELEALLSVDDISLKDSLKSYENMEVAKAGPCRVLQLVSMLIFTIELLNGNPKFNKPKHLKCVLHPAFIREALVFAFIVMGRLIERCMTANPVALSPLLPGILVFVEWLVEILDKAEEASWTDKRCETAMIYFLNSLGDLLDQFVENECIDTMWLWEDRELNGFTLIIKSHVPLSSSTSWELENGYEDKHECDVRQSRIVSAAMKIVNQKNGSWKWNSYEVMKRKFSPKESKKILKLDVQCNVDQNVPVQADSYLAEEEEEEEEVIVFKPIVRHNSAPVGGITDNILPHDPRCNNSLWNIPEHTELDSCAGLTVSPSFAKIETNSAAGPPSLSAWNIGMEDIGTFREKNVKGYCEHPINKGAVSERDLNVESSVSTSHLTRESFSSSSTTYYEEPPNANPVPSAPPLPDDATWFSHNVPSHYVQLADRKNMEEQFNDRRHANGYSNMIPTRSLTNFAPPDVAQTQGHFWGSPDSFQDQKEAAFRGHQKPSVYEQQLLLQYLKEKEWRLQLELQLRGRI